MSLPHAFAVTTGHSARADTIARAHAVANRCQVAYIPRVGSLQRTSLQAGVDLLYVVERQRESLRTPSGERIGVDEGMLRTRLHGGDKHPLIEATKISGLRQIVDGTLGLGHDALHLAGAWGIPILGAEASPAVFSLLEAGLKQLKQRPEPTRQAACLVEPHPMRAAQLLATLPPGSADVLLLAPMFSSPKNAAPGYPLFRSVAIHDPLEEDTLQAAHQAKIRRIVLKLARGTSPPSIWKGATDHVIQAKANAYWMWDLPTRR